MNDDICPVQKRVLLTGGSGYLGRYLVDRLGREFALRVLDVVPVEGAPEFVLGSVADQSVVDRAMAGMDAAVIAHMAPNRDGNYDSLDLPFDVNVKGAACVFDAAARLNVRRIVLISSTATVDRARCSGEFLDASLSPSPTSLYGLTKVLQEDIARYYHGKFGLTVAVLRPAYIITEEPLEDKYGRVPAGVNWQFIDPRDIAGAAALALVEPRINFEIFYPLGGPGAELRADVAHLKNMLGWSAGHPFSRYPADP